MEPEKLISLSDAYNLGKDMGYLEGYLKGLKEARRAK